MDTIFQTLLSWQFLMFCLGIAGLVFVIRRAVEYFLKVKNITKYNYLWETLILPIMPLGLGSLLGWVAKAYPYPGAITSASGRVFFGLVAGMLSGLVYRVLKGLLVKQLMNVDEGILKNQFSDPDKINQ